MGKASRVKGAYKDKNKSKISRELTLDEIKGGLAEAVAGESSAVGIPFNEAIAHFNIGRLVNRREAGVELFRIILGALNGVNGMGRYNTLVFRVRPPEVINPKNGEKKNFFIENIGETITILTWDIIGGEWDLFSRLNNNFSYFMKVFTESVTTAPQSIPEGFVYREGMLVAGLFNSTVPTLENPTQQELANALTSMENDSYGWRLAPMKITETANLRVNPKDKAAVHTENILNIYQGYLSTVGAVALENNEPQETINIEEIENNRIYKALTEYSLNRDGNYVLHNISSSAGGEELLVNDSWSVTDGVLTPPTNNWSSLSKTSEIISGGGDCTLILEVNNSEFNNVFGWKVVRGELNALSNSSEVSEAFPSKYKRIKTLHERVYKVGFEI